MHQKFVKTLKINFKRKTLMIFGLYEWNQEEIGFKKKNVLVTKVTDRVR